MVEPRRYRLFVDESGDANVKSVDDARYRYLGLTGVALDLTDHEDAVTRDLNKLKAAHFPGHPPGFPILVRSRLVRMEAPFQALRDAANRGFWERGILEFFQAHATDLITVVVDKRRSQDRYGREDEDPYLRAMRFMIERYRAVLYYRSSVGDVLVEARGKEEDRRLRKAYDFLYRHGTGWRSAAELQAALTSRELKLAAKSKNIAGLQVADLLAHPAKEGILQDHRGVERRPGTFSQRVIEEIRASYHPSNRVIFPK
ncbi:MAG TPA: DUF3800 domain-containing protein [Actinomycetota bacterium]|jgi:hypothetical protein|nr:DUF3800 domain-containing protein [Actinomycetota bacterium]